MITLSKIKSFVIEKSKRIQKVVEYGAKTAKTAKAAKAIKTSKTADTAETRRATKAGAKP